MSAKPIDRVKLLLAVSSAICLLGTRPATAYVDLAPTLGKIAGDSKAIALVEVVSFNSDSQTVTFKSVKTLKGDPVRELITNRVAPANAFAAPTVRMWAETGSRGVWFATSKTALLCMGSGWYQVKQSGRDGWKLGVDRPDLPLAYCGTVSRLSSAIEAMVAGKTAVITSIIYGATDVDTSFDLALGRNNLPGLARVQRTNASVSMPGMVMAAASGDNVIGIGPVDVAELPKLREALGAIDAGVRAEAAESIGYLGKAGRVAADDLTKALSDESVSVRTAAAAAQLRVTPSATAALDVLGKQLASDDGRLRRDACTAAALAGTPAAGLAPKLIQLMTDDNEAVRVAAIQAVTTLGPSISSADAASAVKVLVPMLSDVHWRVEAADALGRLGKAARPVPEPLVAMLSDPQPSIYWAAVRAMAQIGGPEAKPAVAVIKERLPTGSEVEQYNMMLYCALLGPEAADVAPTIRSNRIKNPVLPSATLWAIGDTTKLPWQQQNDRRGPGGFGGPPGGGPDGGGGPGDINRYMYSAYFRELGERLAPAAKAFADKLLAGTAGEVPEWGYALLNADTAGSLATLTAALSSDDRVVRQRAVVAIGYMGPAATAAKPQVETALAKADPRDQKMLNWALKRITVDE